MSGIMRWGDSNVELPVQKEGTAIQQAERRANEVLSHVPSCGSKAALFGFCLSLVAYNVLAVVLAALRGVHGEDIVDQEVSLYYIANEIATTYHGMMIAIPEPEWDLFYAMSLTELAAIFQALAQRVNLRAFRKSPRGPKKPRPERSGTPMSGHVSTAKLLMS